GDTMLAKGCGSGGVGGTGSIPLGRCSSSSDLIGSTGSACGSVLTKGPDLWIDVLVDCIRGAGNFSASDRTSSGAIGAVFSHKDSNHLRSTLTGSASSN